MTTTDPGTRTCPACSAVISAKARACPICKLEASKMDAFAAAKRAAAQRGVRKTSVEGQAPPFYMQLLKPIVIVPAIIVLAVIYFITKPGAAPPWTRFPTTPTGAAQALFADIEKDDAKAIEHAYSLLSPSVKDPKAEDEQGQYGQIFRTLDRYLAAEIGP